MRIPISAVILTLAAGVAAAQPAVAPADAFYDAIRAGDRTRLAALIKAHGTAVTDAQGLTPLIMAASVGTTDAMRSLLAARADARAASSAGVTALHMAVTDLDKTRLLVDAGADVNAASAIGRTPLLAAASVHGSIEVVRLLLERGATIDATDNAGATPLAAAALVDNGAVARLLLDRGATAKTGAGGSPLGMPLFGAATNGNAGLVRALVAKGADVNATTTELGNLVKHGRTMFSRISPLHVGVNSLDLETVRALLDAGAQIDPLDIRNMTPLMFAVATDRPNPAIVSLLVKSGARLDLRDKEGETAIDWARKFNHPGVLAALNMTAPAPARTVAAALMPSHAAAARQAVERALPPLRDVSDTFITKGGCVACHAQPLTEVATTLASQRGWTPAGTSPDLTTLAANFNANIPVWMQLREAGGQPDGFLYTTLALVAQQRPASRASDVMVRYLSAKQRATGEWEGIGGTRAPMQDGDINRTALAIRALTIYAPPAQASHYRERVRRAADWLRQQELVSTQDVVMQALGLHWANLHAATRKARIADLLALQRPDGGWGQTLQLPSDAYATGQALYALRTLGVKPGDAALRRGVAFLVSTQQKDGTWHVVNRAMKLQPYFDSGFPYEHDQWISHAGSAWATAGLVLSAPEDTPASARR